MSEEIKTIMEEEYNELYKQLNIKWQLEYKKKLIWLKEKGLINSGIEQKEMLGYIDNLVSDINIKINDLLNNIQDKFGFVMPIQEVNDYINKSIVNNSNYLEKFWNDLNEYYKKQSIMLTESNLIYFNNIKEINRQTLEKTRKEIITTINIKEKKNKENKFKEKRDLIIELIGAITATIGAIAGLVTLLR